MSPIIDIEALRAQLGRRIVEFDEATAAPLRGMAVTFERPGKPPERGQSIPPGWHLAYFLPTVPRSELGQDGLPVSTGVLPPIPLPRRVQAGSKLVFHDSILVGDELRRETEFSDVQLLNTRSGTLILTVQTRRIYTPRGLAITDERQIFFREAVQPEQSTSIPNREPAPNDTIWRREYLPDSLTLFRYSALTMSTHRIHYDHPYSTQHEGYPGLMVHGTFTQQCLLDLVRDNCVGRRIVEFAMRARAPLFGGAAFSVIGRPDEKGAELWAVTPEGIVASHAQITLAEPSKENG